MGVLWPNGWMDQDATWYGGRSRPRRHCVRWGSSSSPPKKKGAQQPHPLFGSCLLWPNGWIDQNATWYGDRPRPSRHCVRWRPISPTESGTAAPRYSPHIYCFQTVAHLSNYWALVIVSEICNFWQAPYNIFVIRGSQYLIKFNPSCGSWCRDKLCNFIRKPSGAVGERLCNSYWNSQVTIWLCIQPSEYSNMAYILTAILYLRGQRKVI